MLDLDQREAWQRVRDGWGMLLAESGGSFDTLIERGGPKEYVRKWQSDVKRWQEAGIPWKFLTSWPAVMALWSMRSQWELAAIDDLTPTTLDLAANELKNTQNAIKRKKGEKEDAPRITAPPSEDPLVSLAQKVQTATKDIPGVSVFAPVNPRESIFETWATPRNLLVAGLVVGGIAILGPTIGASLGSYAAAKGKK